MGPCRRDSTTTCVRAAFAALVNDYASEDSTRVVHPGDEHRLAHLARSRCRLQRTRLASSAGCGRMKP